MDEVNITELESSIDEIDKRVLFSPGMVKMHVFARN
jgi:hypothetical protein